MKDDELDAFANKFINLWQENFHKAIADGKIIEYMMQGAANMQQFYDNKIYDKSLAAAFSSPFDAWNVQHGGGNVDSRIDELERRIAALEKGNGKAGAKNKRGGKK